MKKIVLTALLLVAIFTTEAQNETKKWAFGANLSLIDFSGPQTKQFFKLKNYRGNHRYFLGRYLNPSFNLKGDFTFGKVWFPEVSAFPEVVANSYENRHIYDFGLNLEYKFNNGYILKEEAILAPYIFTGLGFNTVIDYGKANGTDVNTYIPFGVGLTIRALDWLSFNLQSSYKLNFDNSFDYLQQSIGAVLNFGGKSKDGKSKDAKDTVVDSDNDGVADLMDECPFAAGTAAMFGCPDTDGDGLGDSRDECPKLAGTLINKGCPSKDSDGDGVADDKDSCPNIKGEIRYAGCPDTDGDGIVDKYDNCPNQVGNASNNGCPLEKVANNSTTITDNVVSQPTYNNSGKLVEKVIVYFTPGSNLLPSSEKAKLNKVLYTLKSNPSYEALIKGYTDMKGDESKNVTLSLNRANAVWEYLTKNGMDGNQGLLYGYGEYNPISSNDKENRRVEVEIVK